MMEAPSLRSGSAFWTVKSVPLTLTPNARSKCSSVTVAERSAFGDASVAKRMSIRPLTSFHRRIQPIEVSELSKRRPGCGDVPADLRDGNVELALAATRDADVGAVRHEPLCRGEANPAAAAVTRATLPSSFSHDPSTSLSS